VQPELKIKKKIMDYLKTVAGCHAVRIEQRPGVGAGVADIIVCYQGKYVALEVKIPGGRATPLQMHFLKQITIAGGLSAVVCSVEEVKCLIQMLALMPPLPIGEGDSPLSPLKRTKNPISNGPATRPKSQPRMK
jgi:hypothetical protein